jgi:hypothetical protein
VSVDVTNQTRTATSRKAWSWLIAFILVVAVVLGTTLIRHNDAGPLLSGQITVTGYGVLSAMNPSSSDPTSVILTNAQSRALNQLVTALPQETRDTNCMENEVLFTISAVSRLGGTSLTQATEWLCPAPGFLALQTSSGSHEKLGGACTLRPFMDRIFAGKKAAGAKSALQQVCH